MRGGRQHPGAAGECPGQDQCVREGGSLRIMKTFRVIVVGLGVQGQKRRAAAGGDFVCTADPFNPQADYKSAYDVPLDAYDAALACIPDEPKVELLRYFLSHG